MVAAAAAAAGEKREERGKAARKLDGMGSGSFMHDAVAGLGEGAFDPEDLDEEFERLQ